MINNIVINVIVDYNSVFHIVSRYRGYCPQLKYRVGKTYGKDTFEIAEVIQYSRSTLRGGELIFTRVVRTTWYL